MSPRASITETPVLIVGGGPIGLALAADLGRRGVGRCWSRSARTSSAPPRCWRSASAPWSSAGSSASPTGCATGVFRPTGRSTAHSSPTCRATSSAACARPRSARQPHSEFSPERGRPCPQTWFDPILQDCARSFPQLAIRHRVRLESFTQDADGVTATVRDQQSGRVETVRARLSGRLRRLRHDGARAARHRAARRAASRLVDDDLSAHPGFLRYHDKEKAFRYVFVGPEGTWSFLSIVDGKDLWRLQIVGMDETGCRTPTSRR